MDAIRVYNPLRPPFTLNGVEGLRSDGQSPLGVVGLRSGGQSPLGVVGLRSGGQSPLGVVGGRAPYALGTPYIISYCNIWKNTLFIQGLSPSFIY